MGVNVRSSGELRAVAFALRFSERLAMLEIRDPQQIEWVRRRKWPKSFGRKGE